MCKFKEHETLCLQMRLLRHIGTTFERLDEAEGEFEYSVRGTGERIALSEQLSVSVSNAVGGDGKLDGKLTFCR